MSSAGEDVLEAAPGVAALLVLGAGLVALGTGDPSFWLYWVVGFAVVVPLVAMLAPVGPTTAGYVGRCARACWDLTGLATAREADGRPVRDGETADALATLRDRYARGDLTDEQFERKLDRLLATETPEDAVEWRARELEAEETG